MLAYVNQGSARVIRPCARPMSPPGTGSKDSARCARLMMRSWMPARANASICHSISRLPPALSRGLAIWSDNGRMRSPRPAAKISAFIGSERVADARRNAFELVEKACERQQLGVALGHAAHVLHEARRVGEVLRFAVSIVDAGENAEHLQVTLQAHPFERAIELAEVGIDRQRGGARGLPIPHGPVEYAFFIPAYECVAHQRCDVVGDGAEHRILEIEDPGIGSAEHQVARHVVAMYVHGGLRETGIEDE